MSDELLRGAKNSLTLQEAAVDYGNLPEGEKITMRANNTYLRDLIAEIERLRAALQAIVKHQDTIGGGMASMSATRRIAAEALKPSPQGE